MEVLLVQLLGLEHGCFNKIFNKTPTEFAFDLSGISNLWKKDKEKSVKTPLIEKKNFLQCKFLK